MKNISIFSVVILLSCSATISLQLDLSKETRHRVNYGPSRGNHRSGDFNVGLPSYTPDLDIGSTINGAFIISKNPIDAIDPIINNPLFNIPLFNVFGVGVGPYLDAPQLNPWWLGPNVCTERKEEVIDWSSPIPSLNRQRTTGQISTTYSISLKINPNHCIQKIDKRICTSIVVDKGQKTVLSVSQKCCHGYGRMKTLSASNIFEPCEKINLLSVIETSERLNGSEYVHAAQKNGVENELKQNVTLFMPTDTVFTEFTAQMNSTDKISGITTKSIIMNHIVPDMASTENEQLLITKYENHTIRMNIFRRPPPVSLQPPPSSFAEYDERLHIYTANCVPIMKFDQKAENGIVHVVDRVLMPVTQSLMELIREREDMAVLRTILEKTDLAEQLEDVGKHFTLFAPTDKAFEKLDPHVRRTIKERKGCALNILKNHILGMTLCTAATFEGIEISAINELDEKIIMERVSVKHNVSETPTETDGLAERKSIVIINGKSQITEADIMATNGVMHVIDTFLPTDSSRPFTSLLQSRNSTLFKTLLELNGISDLVDSYENVSLFAPTDSALKSTIWVKKIESDPDSLKGNKELTNFLQYHIAKPSITTCDITSERSLESETGDLLRVNLVYPRQSHINRATVNCARLVHVDENSCGSTLHQIDRPIHPPSQNILEMLKANEQYSIFVGLLETTNLTSLLENMNRSLTVLVPKNDVFTEVKEYFDVLTAAGNEKKLENIVKLHIIDDALCCAAIGQFQWPFVRLVKTINNINLKLNRDQRPKIQNAGVTKCDIIATNGVIHEVNDVINTRQTHHAPRTPAESKYYSLVPQQPFQNYSPLQSS